MKGGMLPPRVNKKEEMKFMANTESNQKLTYGQVAAMAKQDPETFASALLGSKPTYRSSMQVRYYENGSLVVNVSGPAQGKYKSFIDETVKGDMLDLVRHIHGLPDDKQGRHEAAPPQPRVRQAPLRRGLGPGPRAAAPRRPGPRSNSILAKSSGRSVKN